MIDFCLCSSCFIAYACGDDSGGAGPGDAINSLNLPKLLHRTELLPLLVLLHCICVGR